MTAHDEELDLGHCAGSGQDFIPAEKGESRVRHIAEDRELVRKRGRRRRRHLAREDDELGVDPDRRELFGEPRGTREVSLSTCRIEGTSQVA